MTVEKKGWSVRDGVLQMNRDLVTLKRGLFIHSVQGMNDFRDPEFSASRYPSEYALRRFGSWYRFSMNDYPMPTRTEEDWVYGGWPTVDL